MQRLTIVSLAVIALVLSVPSWAQQTVDSASVSGRVVDPSGGVVPGAEVVVRHLDTNVASVALTDDTGRFRFPYLRVGRYALLVRLSGFRDSALSLALNAGAAFELPIVLALDTVETTVSVSAASQPLETARSQIARTVSQSEITSLPLNGRNFLEVALLAPGVAPTNIASTQLFPETSAVPGVSLSVNSQRNLSNSFIVDGLSANDDAAGLSGITYGVDAIAEFQVVTSGGQAELGRALGGYVNIVTRSGSNTRSGTTYGFWRDDALNARNALSGTTLPMRQTQAGGSLGGPLSRDRSFYFANVEHRRLNQTGLTTIGEANLAAIHSRLDLTAYRGPRPATGLYDNPVRTTNAFARIDHQASPRSQITARYSMYAVDAENSRGAGGLSASTASTDLANVDHAFAVSHLFFVSPRTVLETRGQVTHSDLNAPPSDTVGPAVSIAGIATFGTSSSSPTGRQNTMTQLVHNLSHQAGAHALRAGVDLLVNADRITFPRARQGSYTFSSLTNFLAGVYNNAGFTQTFGDSDVAQQNPNLGLFVQDEWKLGSAVTLNLGLRYDLQWMETISTDTNNVSPRIGVAIAPFSSRRTVIRSSAGLYFDRVPLRALANALLSASNTTDPAALRQVNVSLAPTQTGAPTFPQVLSGPVAAVTLPNLTTMDRQLQNAYSRPASVEVEQQVADRATVSVGYEYVRGRHLLMTINQNVPTCVATGTNNGCRPMSSYANNSQYSSAGESNYHGLHATWTAKPSSWGHYRVSYSWSKSMNNVGEFFFSGPIDPTDLSKDWGRSDNDRRHRLVANGTVDILGFQAGAMLQSYSGAPLNITSGVTTIQGTAGRPLVEGAFIARNAGENTAFFTLGARVGRRFSAARGTSVELLVEGFNLTNRINVLTRNTNFGAGSYPANPSASFMQITSVGEPRSFQLGARIRF